MRIPSFMIGDYEHASTAISRLTGSILLYPDVIEREVLLRRGLRSSQLIPFRGLKEDLTFARVDVDAVEPYRLPPYADGAVRVLFRPPSETSHYYREASTKLARATLGHLGRGGALVVFAPRDPSQAALLEGLHFAYPPVVLGSPVPFVALLKGVDAVVCGGGTMLREAAYLGIPSYSIFQSKIGAVDRWLEQIGRARLLRGPQDLARIQLGPRPPLQRLDSNPHLLDELVETVLAGAIRGSQPTRTERAKSVA
jgi:predicted glycosyltransferase